MPKEDHIGDLWAENTLSRAVTVGQHVYERAIARKVEWPERRPASKAPIESPSYTSVDDAFSSVLQFMSQTTRHCKRYYDTNKRGGLNECDSHHCNRFHTPTYSTIRHSNPLQRTEDVHVLVTPGTYAVTAEPWGQGQRKHVVHLKEGQSVDLDFCVI